MRIFRAPFDRVLKKMIQLKYWESIQERYGQYIPDLCTILGYIIRFIYKTLFGQNFATMYDLYQIRGRRADSLTQGVIETLAASRNCSREKRAARAILCST